MNCKRKIGKVFIGLVAAKRLLWEIQRNLTGNRKKANLFPQLSG